MNRLLIGMFVYELNEETILSSGRRLSWYDGFNERQTFRILKACTIGVEKVFVEKVFVENANGDARWIDFCNVKLTESGRVAQAMGEYTNAPSDPILFFQFDNINH